MANVQVFVIDGPDGVGKSTLIKKLVNYFNGGSSYKAYAFSPSNTPYGSSIKAVIATHELSNDVQARLHLTTLSHLLENYITPIIEFSDNVEYKQIIFIDRWIDSTAIYQRFAPLKDPHGFPIYLGEDVGKYSLGVRSRTFILDASDETLNERLYGTRDGFEKYEVPEFQEWVRLGYRRIFDYDGIGNRYQINVDDKDVEVNFKKLLQEVLRYLD